MFLTLENELKRVDHAYLEFFNKFFFKLCTFSVFWLAVLFVKMCLPYFNSLQHKHNTPVSFLTSEILYAYTEGQQIFFNLVLK